MATEHSITPPPELVEQWEDQHFHGGENYDVVLIKAYQAGADQQLAEDAKWLDHHALNEAHLKTIPVGDLLKEAMRAKPPSLKEQALAELELLKGDANTHGLGFDAPAIRRALESLPD